MPEFDFEAAREFLKSSVVHYGRVNGKFKTIQFMQTALFAIEKQIKKKPLKKTLEYNGEYGECPCCGRIVNDFDNIKRCPECGQAIDWS